MPKREDILILASSHDLIAAFERNQDRSEKWRFYRENGYPISGYFNPSEAMCWLLGYAAGKQSKEDQ